jgi:TRAP-type transport system periplasmic protein
LQVLKELGIDGVTGPMPEAYMNMQKGVWDGAFSSYAELKAMKLSDVAKYVTILNLWRVPTASRAMCLTTWNNLPPDIKEVFQKNIQWYNQHTEKGIVDADKAGLDYGGANGVTFFSLPKEDTAKFKELMLKDAVKEAEKIDAKGLPGTKILQEVQRLIKTYEK